MRADKSLGQHFLTDDGVIDQLVSAIAPKPGQSLVEIGPGLGALTVPVLKQCQKLTVIEFDRRVIAPLKAVTATIGELNIVQADVLTVNFATLDLPLPVRLIGNLPYNISSPIVFHCLQQREHICDMHFMLQKEVVERMEAPPGSKTYGRLSIMTQLYCEVENLFDIAPQAFNPPPKVDSALVRLTPLAAPAWEIINFGLFDRLVREAFQQRRKMIRKSLRAYFTEEQLSALQIDPTARPEMLGGETFARMANYLVNHSPQSSV